MIAMWGWYCLVCHPNHGCPERHPYDALIEYLLDDLRLGDL